MCVSESDANFTVLAFCELLSMHEAVQKWELQDMIYGQGT
jgi:hypothetical protein